MNTFKVKCLSTNQTHTWSLKEVLYEINRDRSYEWTDYTTNDFKEGWNTWVEGCGFYTMVQS
jgi:hypothetical protein